MHLMGQVVVYVLRGRCPKRVALSVSCIGRDPGYPLGLHHLCVSGT